MFFQHAHVGHDHAPVDGLAHVVDRQQADLHGRQRFHFHARLAGRIDLGAAVHAVGCFMPFFVLDPLGGTTLGQDFTPV